MTRARGSGRVQTFPRHTAPYIPRTNQDQHASVWPRGPADPVGGRSPFAGSPFPGGPVPLPVDPDRRPERTQPPRAIQPYVYRICKDAVSPSRT